MLLLANRKIVFSPFARCLTQPLQYFYILPSFDWSRSSLIQRRAGFDRTRSYSGLNLEKLFISRLNLPSMETRLQLLPKDNTYLIQNKLAKNKNHS